MTAQDVQLLSGLRIPDGGGVVGAACHDQVTIFGILSSQDRCRMSCLKGWHLLPGLNIPQTSRFIVAGRQDVITVRRKRYAVDRGLVPGEGEERLGSLYIP